MKKNNELQTRREFFKKAATSTLPILAVAVLGPSILSSCDEPNAPSTGGGSSNSTSCDTCKGGCGSSCASDCRAKASYQPSSCKGSSCTGACMSSCKSLCMRTAKIGLSN